MKDKTIEHFKQMNELILHQGESSGNEPLSTFGSLEESITDGDDDQKSSIDMEPAFFNNIKRQIENNICEIKTVVVNLNKMRGKF